MTTKKTYRVLLLLLLPLVSLAQEKSKKPTTSIDTVRVEGRVGLEIFFKEMPGQRFVLEIPEIFTLRDMRNGLFNYSNQVWTLNKKGAVLDLEDEQYRYSIQLRPARSKNAVGIKWTISFFNKTAQSLYDLAAFNCWTMNTAPLFKDVQMERTTVRDASGNAMLLKDVRKRQGDGRRTMQFYPSVTGVDLTKSTWIKQWDVISDQPLSGNNVSILSTDAKWVFENKVTGNVAYFFNNWEGDHGCVHASPLLATELKPGQKARASGEFRFTRRNTFL
jgi:hypothetical protein